MHTNLINYALLWNYTSVFFIYHKYRWLNKSVKTYAFRYSTESEVNSENSLVFIFNPFTFRNFTHI